MLSDERLERPYSVDNLREILEFLRRSSLTDLRVEDAINANEGGPATLIGSLQLLAVEYILYRELETRPKYKNYREILRHIAAADFEALPEAIRARIIPPALVSCLRNFREVRHNASAIIGSPPKRGAVKKYARYYLVQELADLYERVTGRQASKVGKAPSGRHKLTGRFYGFVLAALEPIDAAACAGVHYVINDVIQARRARLDLNLPL